MIVLGSYGAVDVCGPKSFSFPYKQSITVATQRGANMHVSNTETIPGFQVVAFHGVVTGSTVRAKHIGRDLMAGLKNLVGGELKGYTELLQEAREEAFERMKSQATSVGANAVVNVRFGTSSVAQGAAELFAYGTAVTVENS
jgi:uncharacterized protein YbjQ (UPF0145 family)